MPSLRENSQSLFPISISALNALMTYNSKAQFIMKLMKLKLWGLSLEQTCTQLLFTILYYFHSAPSSYTKLHKSFPRTFMCIIYRTDKTEDLFFKSRQESKVWSIIYHFLVSKDRVLLAEIFTTNLCSMLHFLKACVTSILWYISLFSFSPE